MASTKVKLNRTKRKVKVRARIKSYSENKLRLSVFRSNKHFYAQLIDWQKGKTILSMSDLKVKEKKRSKLSEKTLKLGQEFGKKMLELGINEAAFDRSFYKFHGLIKSFAQGVKKAGVNI